MLRASLLTAFKSTAELILSRALPRDIVRSNIIILFVYQFEAIIIVPPDTVPLFWFNGARPNKSIEVVCPDSLPSPWIRLIHLSNDLFLLPSGPPSTTKWVSIGDGDQKIKGMSWHRDGEVINNCSLLKDRILVRLCFREFL